MTLKDITARVGRLDELARGLAKELALLGDAKDPLLYVERAGYKGAIGKALAGVEEARVVLAQARQRLESDGPGEQPKEASKGEGK